MRHPITQDQILAVADLLAERNERVTLARVRQELGGGSYTTIGQALREWRHAQKGVAAVVPVRFPLPFQLKAVIKEACLKVWHMATEATEKAARERIKALEDENESLKAKLKRRKEA